MTEPTLRSANPGRSGELTTGPDIGKMAPRAFSPPRRRFALTGRQWSASLDAGWRYLTAGSRRLPDFVIVGAQRAGTTSLYLWLRDNPGFEPPAKKEIHFFDTHYYKGMRWYRSQFPIRGRRKITGEASPYMLFHPLAPERAARDLPQTTRFIVLLRDPVERAISHYWFSRQNELWETEPLERAIELEPFRLAAVREQVYSGKRSYGYATFSYLSRGEYAPQLRRWFDAVGRERMLLVESERLFVDHAVQSTVLDWLGLPPQAEDFPASHHFERRAPISPELDAKLRSHFAPHNRELFELLGFELWKE